MKEALTPMIFQVPTDLAEDDRIDLDGKGHLDDVAIKDVDMFRLEYMSRKGIWIRLYRHGKTDIVIHLNSNSGISAIVELEPSERIT
jgi:hypothetical protein